MPLKLRPWIPIAIFATAAWTAFAMSAIILGDVNIPALVVASMFTAMLFMLPFLRPTAGPAHSRFCRECGAADWPETFGFCLRCGSTRPFADVAPTYR